MSRRDVAQRRSVSPFSQWSHGSDARKEHDLRTNRWQEDKVHRTVRLNETNPERKGGWNSRSVATKHSADWEGTRPSTRPRDEDI